MKKLELLIKSLIEKQNEIDQKIDFLIERNEWNFKQLRKELIKGAHKSRYAEGEKVHIRGKNKQLFTGIIRHVGVTILSPTNDAYNCYRVKIDKSLPENEGYLGDEYTLLPEYKIKMFDPSLTTPSQPLTVSNTPESKPAEDHPPVPEK